MQVIQIHLSAPGKPAVGEPCNGCGICCLSEPCPLGIVLSGRCKGFCDALRWEAGTNTYRCGAIIDPQAVMHHALPRGLKAWSIVMAPWLRRLAGRWIAAGTGCDCDLDVVVGVQSDRQSGT